MARLTPNSHVFKMIGLAIGFTYFGAFAVADAWEMSISEVIDQYPFYFYGTMALAVTLALQEEIQEQKEAMREEERRSSDQSKVQKDPEKTKE